MEKDFLNSLVYVGEGRTYLGREDKIYGIGDGLILGGKVRFSW